MGRKLIGVLGVWIVACAALVAADFWEDEEFLKWSDRDVQKMMTDSPWAKRVRIVMGGLREEEASRFTGDGVNFGGGGGRRGGGDGGFAGVRRTDVIVMWMNALPVRQAMVRGLVGREGAIPPEGQQFLSEEDPFYTIAVIGLPPAFGRALPTMADLNAETELKRRNKDPLKPVDIGFLRDEDQSLRAMFMFPRDEPLTLDDREVEFVTKLGGITDIKRKFNLRDMRIDGRLAL